MEINKMTAEERIKEFGYDPKALVRELRVRQRSAVMIEKLRIESGLALEQVQRLTGFSEWQIRSWETGFVSPMSSAIGKYMAICGAKASSHFQLAFNELLMETHQRIAEIKATAFQPSQIPNFSASGAVSKFKAAA